MRNYNEIVGSIKGKNGAGREFSFDLSLGDVKHLRRIMQFYSIHPTLIGHKYNNNLIEKFKSFGVRHGRNKDANQTTVKMDGKCSIDRCYRKDLTVDHITPLGFGGTNEKSNLRVLCRKHHDIVEYERTIDRLSKRRDILKREVDNGN